MSLSALALDRPIPPAFRQLCFEDNQKSLLLAGSHDENLTQFEETLDVLVIHRGSVIAVIGHDIQRIKATARIFDEFYQSTGHGTQPSPDAFNELLRQWGPLPVQSSLLAPDIAPKIVLQTPPAGPTSPNAPNPSSIDPSWYALTTLRRNLTVRNQNQDRHLHAIRESTMIFGLGAVSTSKTFLSIAMAVSMVYRDEIERIII